MRPPGSCVSLGRRRRNGNLTLRSTNKMHPRHRHCHWHMQRPCYSGTTLGTYLLLLRCRDGRGESSTKSPLALAAFLAWELQGHWRKPKPKNQGGNKEMSKESRTEKPKKVLLTR